MPLAIARSMLSFGIDASLALRIAFSSAALPSGSPPPSRAATVIARASLVNCAPRRESTIAFLCLMLDHLECPDMAPILGARRRARSAAHRMRGHGRARRAIFKAYDIRGIYGEQIDGDLAEQIGRAFARMLAELAAGRSAS